MKTQVIPLLVLGAVLIGCSHPQRTVILDSWWDVDYAKQSCLNRTPCTPDPVQAVHEFEAELVTQFATQAACSSVRLVRYSGPKEPDKVSAEAIKKPYWHLSLNFTPSESKQQWQLAQHMKAAVLQGNGTPSEIAKQVCSIVSGNGATIAN